MASTPATIATKLGLVVSIPGDGSVTGQAFNSTGGFNSDNFLFVSEDGTISGWRGALGTRAETLAAGSASNVYKGSAFERRVHPTCTRRTSETIRSTC